MGVTWEEQRWQLKTDQNGVGVWSNAFTSTTWMQVEARSSSRSKALGNFLQIVCAREREF